MPAYNYFPSGYQPFVGQSYFQQQQNPYLQQQAQTTGIIWVSGDAEADSYPIAPNNAVTLWNRTQPIVYFKQADASGRPSMRIYDLVEHKAPTPPETPIQSVSDYATKNDIEEIEKRIRVIKREIEALQKAGAEDDAE